MALKEIWFYAIILWKDLLWVEWLGWKSKGSGDCSKELDRRHYILIHDRGGQAYVMDSVMGAPPPLLWSTCIFLNCSVQCFSMSDMPHPTTAGKELSLGD